MALNVIFAVYGGLRAGGQDNTEASDVKDALQQRFSPGSNGVVTINNTTMGGDPAVGVRKHFGAIVEVEPGVRRAFACEENQTIDFS